MFRKRFVVNFLFHFNNCWVPFFYFFIEIELFRHGICGLDICLDTVRAITHIYWQEQSRRIFGNDILRKIHITGNAIIFLSSIAIDVSSKKVNCWVEIQRQNLNNYREGGSCLRNDLLRHGGGRPPLELISSTITDLCLAVYFLYDRIKLTSSPQMFYHTSRALKSSWKPWSKLLRQTAFDFFSRFQYSYRGLYVVVLGVFFRHLVFSPCPRYWLWLLETKTFFLMVNRHNRWMKFTSDDPITVACVVHFVQ